MDETSRGTTPVTGWTPAEIEQRAAWTAPLRRRALRRLGGRLRGARVLEVGCGPGGVCRELAAAGAASVVGVDVDPRLLRVASERGGGPEYHLGNAMALPFADQSFDVVLCHLLLLWVPDPRRAVQEMARVARSGGVVAALAEPDLGGRVDHPDGGYAGWMRASLLARRGHPEAGRRLGEWFHCAGLRPRIRAEVLLLSQPQVREGWDREWEMIRRELGPTVGAAHLDKWKAADRAAVDEGWRVVAQMFFSATAGRV